MNKVLIFITIALTSCFNIKKKNEPLTNDVSEKKININDSLDIRVKELLQAKLTALPLGVNNIFETSKTTLYTKNKDGEIELNDKLIYSSDEEILNGFFHNFYKPNISSSIEADKYPLFDDKDYIKKNGVTSSGLENVIQNKGDVFWCIFYVEYNYKREYETFVKPVRYLVSLNKKLEVLSEFPLSFYYESETRSSIKLFYIDESYNLFTKYYKNKEYEDGRIKESFSELYNYKILPDGAFINK